MLKHQRNENVPKTILSLLMSFLMAFLIFPVQAFAVMADGLGDSFGAALPSVVEVVEQGVVADDGTISDELFAGYVEQQFAAALPESDDMFAQVSAGDNLSGYELAAYNQLKPMMQQVAAGERTSTIFELDTEQIYGKTSWTAAELGSSSIDEAAISQFQRITNIDMAAVVHALLADCPYDLYWFDKTAGYSSFYGISYSSSAISFGDDQRTVCFSVASAYNTGQKTTVGNTEMYVTMNTSTGTLVNTAVANAQAVVDDMTANVAYDKLVYFKEAICDCVEYNHEAADNDDTPYGDPWQLIYVFDGDETTNVVCEGYSKAFKYLCDLADIANVDCILVSGTMYGGTGAGPHMWNIVNMDDGNNYLVDVTNCDEGSVGADDLLFIKPPASGSASEGYTFDCGNSSIGYAYDGEMSSTFGIDALTLSDTEYVTPAGPIASGTWGTCPWEISADGVLTVHPGVGEEQNPRFPTSPWIDCADDITKVVFAEENGQKVIAPQNCNSLLNSLINATAIDLSGLDISQAVNMTSLFRMTSAESLDFSTWDTSSVTSMDNMFYGCTKLASLDLSTWDTSSVASMNQMFMNCTKLETIIVSRAWTTQNVNSSVSMFSRCTNLRGGNGTMFNSSYVDKTYACIDGLNGQPGYLTEYQIYLPLAEVSDIPPQAFTGAAIEPDFTVTYEGRELVEGTDYAVSYVDNVFAGQASIVLSGVSYDAGTKEVSFTINPVNLADCVISFDADEYTYSGHIIEPVVTVTLNGRPMTEGIDYEISFSDNDKPGTGIATISGLGNLVGSETLNFQIVNAASTPISNATITPIPDQYRTGSAIEPEITVTLDGKELEEGTDYTVSYKNNVEVGTATVTITAIGDFYTGTKSTTFKIVYRDISEAAVEAIDDIIYTGSAIEPEVKVTLDGITLRKGADYSVSYENNIEVGAATVTITGKGNYGGTRTVTFNIIPVYVATGTWGTCPWEIGQDGVLTVHPGEGASQAGLWSSPWYDYRENITTIVFVEESGQKAIAPQNSSYLFSSLIKLTSLDVSGLDVSSVTDMSYMFMDCMFSTFELTDWDVSSVQNMSHMFSNATSYDAPYLNLSGWKTSSVTDMSSMFIANSYLRSIDLSGWDVSNAKDVSRLFWQCERLASADLAGWAISSAEDVSEMFRDCSSLASLDFSGSTCVKNMQALFRDCHSLSSLVLRGWDTSAVTDMALVFDECTSLTSLDLSSWRTNSVRTYQSMFYDCTSLVTLDLSGWEIVNTENVKFMFARCEALTTITVTFDDWEESIVGDVVSEENPDEHMFALCRSLVGGNGTSYDYERKEGYELARIDKPGTKGYFTGSDRVSIAKASISGIASQVYTGEPITPGITVNLDGIELTEGVDYNVTYHKNVNAGTAVAVLTGIGNYAGTAKTSFTIGSTGIDDWQFSLDTDRYEDGLPAYEYAGRAIEPKVTVTRNGVVLTEGSDYRLSYGVYANVGSATMTVSGVGNYGGSAAIQYVIVPTGITSATISSSFSNIITYDGQAHHPRWFDVMAGELRVYDDGYTVTYDDDDYVNVGTHAATVHGNGNFTGSIIVPFQIVPQSTEQVDWYTDATVEGGVFADPELNKDGNVVVMTLSKHDGDAAQWYEEQYKGYAEGDVLSTVLYIVSINVEDASGEVVEELTEFDGGGLRLTFPVDTQYNGHSATVVQLHEDEELVHKPRVVDGAVTVTTNCLSEFVVMVEAKSAPTPTEYAVTVTTDGHGTAKASPAKGVAGTKVTLSATPASGYKFKRWQVVKGGVTISGNAFTIGSADVEIKAIFEKEATPTPPAPTNTDLSKASIEPIAAQSYAGKPLTPSVTVKLDGKTLVAGKDYDVAYKDNDKIGTATVTVTGKGDYKGTKSATFEIKKSGSASWKRLSGNGALDTMAEIIDAGGFEQGGTVVLASLEGYWDALTAAGIAGLEDAPVVMALQTELGAKSAATIKELKPSKIIVCGGGYWIPDSVVAQAKAAAGTNPAVVRLAGDNAALTAAKIAEQGKGRWSKTAIVATAGTFQDALAAAPVSYAKKMPIFLAQFDFAAEKGYITADTIKAMKDAGIEQCYIAGGTYWLPASVKSDLEKAGIKVLAQLGGKSAVETSGMIAQLATGSLGMSADGMGAANVSQHYDALASAAFCGKNNSVLVLVSDANRSVVDSFVAKNASKISKGYVFGGEGSVSDASKKALENATK